MPRMTTPRFLLHYAPRTRAGRALWLLEESGLPYELHVHDMTRRTHEEDAFLALNPDGKLPALVDRGDGSATVPDTVGWPVVITESAAVCAYLGDLAPGLSPSIGTPARAAYLTWLTYTAAAIEPAFADLVFPRASPAPAGSIGWPPFEAVVARVARALEHSGARGDWILGAQFTAADVMVGGMLRWLKAWGKLPQHGASESGGSGGSIDRYLAALEARPALQRADAIEAELLARK